MAQTKEGAQKARQVLYEKYGKDYFRNIGQIGGRNGNTGGFAQEIPCECDLIEGAHYKKNCAGKRGGMISRKPQTVFWVKKGTTNG